MPLEVTRKGSNGATRRRDLPLMRGGESALPAAVEGSRRALNVVVAAILVVVSFPLWVLIAIAIKLTSRGPVIYTQTRIGLDARDTGARSDDPRRRRDLGGRLFKIYKFRTMHVDAERETGAVWAAPDDGRTTPVGRILRLYRPDELRSEERRVGKEWRY